MREAYPFDFPMEFGSHAPPYLSFRLSHKFHNLSYATKSSYASIRDIVACQSRDAVDKHGWRQRVHRPISVRGLTFRHAALPRYFPPDRDHGGAARARNRLPLGRRAGLFAPSRPTRSRKPMRSPTRSRAATSTICATSSATSCCRSSTTPKWLRKLANSPSAMSSKAITRKDDPPPSACLRR